MIIRKVKVTEYEYQAPINYVAGATEPDIQFQLTDYEIPSGATGRVYVGRSDGTFEYTVATISGNNVTVAPTSSMFSVKGPGAIQVTLYVGNEIVKNFAVPVYVHADLADDSAEAGSDVTGVFRAAEEQALADFAEDAEAKAAEVIESIPEDYTELTEEVDELNERIGNLSDLETEDKTDIVSAINEAARSGITDEVKTALLACFEKVAWIDEHGQDYYDALYDALYNEEPPVPTDILYQLQDLFVSNGENNIDTGVTLENGESYSICARFVVTEDLGNAVVSFVFSNRDSAGVTEYNGLHLEYDYYSATNIIRRAYGCGLTWGDDRYVKNVMYSFVAVFDKGSSSITAYLRNSVAETITTGSKTFEDSRVYNGKNIILGYHNVSNNPGFHGSIEDFIIKRDVMTSNEIDDYLSGNHKKYTLLTAIGDITASGDNPSETRRLRCMDYIEVDGNTITSYGCPFAPSFYEYEGYKSGNNEITSSIIAYRCYDSTKTYLDTVIMIPNNVETHSQPLPTGTKYVRFIIQKDSAYTYSAGFSNDAIYPLTINGTPYYLKEA